VAKISGPLPASLTLTLADRLYVECSELPQPLINRLIRLSVWDKPRVIGCAENFPKHIALPRGCLEPVQSLLQELGIYCDLMDERQGGAPLELTFVGQLRDDQETAVAAMLRDDIGVLQAPTAFGKTVVAAAILARRGVNTLVLVQRAKQLRKRQERLQTFLDASPGAIGCIGGGRVKTTGRLDIAVMQSLVRQGEVNPLVKTYGQVIVDECHHSAAASFEAILRQVKARYVLGCRPRCCAAMACSRFSSCSAAPFATPLQPLISALVDCFIHPMLIMMALLNCRQAEPFATKKVNSSAMGPRTWQNRLTLL
jgi:hypothetical protein